MSEESVRLSLTKNTATFVLIGDNNFGLKEKYGPLKKDKKNNRMVKAGNEKGNGSTEEDDQLFIGDEKSK